MKRIRFEVLPAGDGSWDLTRDSVVLGNFPVKSLAIEHGMASARSVWSRGQPSQLLIKGRDGRIQDERTYGEDPHPPVG